jgi:nucleotide-binding universal stress UspA family protein
LFVRGKLLESIDRHDHKLFAEALTELAEARAEAVEEAVARAGETARQYGANLEAALFPPSLAPLVGQRIDSLAPLLDKVQVMLYHKCGGPACHNHEHAALQRLLARLGLDPQKTLEALGITPPADPETLEQQGTPPQALAKEWTQATSLAGEKAVPILWLDGNTKKIIGALSETPSPPTRVIVFKPK